VKIRQLAVPIPLKRGIAQGWRQPHGPFSVSSVSRNIHTARIRFLRALCVESFFCRGWPGKASKHIVEGHGPPQAPIHSG
jgi:hypothetical protein